MTGYRALRNAYKSRSSENATLSSRKTLDKRISARHNMKNGQVPPTLKWFDSYSTPQAAEEFVAGAIEETFAKTFYDKYCIDMQTNYTRSSYGMMEIDFGDYGVIPTLSTEEAAKSLNDCNEEENVPSMHVVYPANRNNMDPVAAQLKTYDPGLKTTISLIGIRVIFWEANLTIAQVAEVATNPLARANYP